jgi:hypothetical protein
MLSHFSQSRNEAGIRILFTLTYFYNDNFTSSCYSEDIKIFMFDFNGIIVLYTGQLVGTDCSVHRASCTIRTVGCFLWNEVTGAILSIQLLGWEWWSYTSPPHKT